MAGKTPCLLFFSDGQPRNSNGRYRAGFRCEEMKRDTIEVTAEPAQAPRPEADSELRRLTVSGIVPLLRRRHSEALNMMTGFNSVPFASPHASRVQMG